jgi:hypothetical protein
MTNFDGIPSGLVLEIADPTTYHDRTEFTVRTSMHLKAPVLNQPGSFGVDLWSAGGSYLLGDLQPFRLYDPYMNPGGLWVRYMAGWILRSTLKIDPQQGNTNLFYSLDCVDVNWLWQNPPAMPTTKIRVGAAPVWLPTHQYVSGDQVQPNPSNRHKYTASGGTSAALPPTWPTGAGATVTDGSITWTCRQSPTRSPSGSRTARSR